MAWLYPTVKKIEDKFIPFDRIHERDRQTDGQAPYDGISRAYAYHRAEKKHACIVRIACYFTLANMEGWAVKS